MERGQFSWQFAIPMSNAMILSVAFGLVKLRTQDLARHVLSRKRAARSGHAGRSLCQVPHLAGKLKLPVPEAVVRGLGELCLFYQWLAQRGAVELD